MRKESGDVAGAEQIATILAQQGTQEALAVDQGVADQALPAVDTGVAALAQPAVDQGVTTQQAPPVQPQKQYDDVPSVPQFNTNVSPAQNLADQTTGSNLWNNKIETSLQEGKKNIWGRMADKTVETLYGGRYDTLGQLVKDAEVLPGFGTAPEMFFAKDWNPITEKYENTWKGPDSVAGKMLSDPGFLETVGLIFAPAVHHAISNLPQYRQFLAAPGPVKLMLIPALMTTLGAITGGQISNMIRNGPWAKTELGTLDLGEGGVGSKFKNLMLGGDPETLLGQARTGFAWGVVPPVVMGAGVKALQAGASKFAGLKPETIGAAEAQLAAAERLSELSPQNVKAFSEWSTMKGQPWNIPLPFLEKIPGLGRTKLEKTLGVAEPSINLPGSLRAAMPATVPLTKGRVPMPEPIRGPTRMEMDPTNRLMAGKIGTELYSIAQNPIASAIQAAAAFPFIGKYIKSSASYNSMVALVNMERKLGQLSEAIGKEEASMLAVQGAKNWGLKRVQQEDRLWEIYKARAAKVSIPGQAVGDIVPIAGIRAVTADLRQTQGRTPLMKPREPGGPAEPMVYDPTSVEAIGKWAENWERGLGEYTSVERLLNLKRQVDITLNSAVEGTPAAYYAIQYSNALRSALGKDVLAEGKALGAEGAALGAEGKALVGVGKELRDIANMYKASRKVSELNKTAFETTAAQQFTKIDKDFFKEKTLTSRWVNQGSKEASELLEFAFKSNNTQYLKTMREMMGKDGYNAAVRVRISEAFNASLEKAAPGSQLMQKFQSMVAPRANPQKLNLNTFQRELGLGGEAFPVEGRKAITEMLRLTGTGITPQVLDDLALVLSRYTVNFDLATMAARRIPIGGVKGFISALTAGLSKTAGTGAAGGTGLALGGSTGMLSAVAGLVLLNQIGRLATSDKVVRSLIKYVKNNEKLSASARSAQHRKRIARAGFLKLMGEIGVDNEDSEGLYNAIVGEIPDAKYYYKYPGEAVSKGAGMLRSVLPGQ